MYLIEVQLIYKAEHPAFLYSSQVYMYMYCQLMTHLLTLCLEVKTEYMQEIHILNTQFWTRNSKHLWCLSINLNGVINNAVNLMVSIHVHCTYMDRSHVSVSNDKVIFLYRLVVQNNIKGNWLYWPTLSITPNQTVIHLKVGVQYLGINKYCIHLIGQHSRLVAALEQ